MDLSEQHALETYLLGRLSLQIVNVRHGLKKLSDPAAMAHKPSHQDAVNRIDLLLQERDAEALLFLDEARTTHQMGTPMTAERPRHGVRAATLRSGTVHGMAY